MQLALATFAVVIVGMMISMISCAAYKVKKHQASGVYNQIVSHTPTLLLHCNYYGDHQQGGNPSDDVNMEMQKCGAYDVVQLSRQKVIMNDNPAYGEIGDYISII